MKALKCFAVIMAILIGAPLLVVIPMSFSASESFRFPPPAWSMHYYSAFFNDPTWTGPAINSLLIGLGTAALTLALVIPAAFALVRYEFRGRAFGSLLILLPLTVPNIVVALGYFYYFGSLRLTQTYLGVILAHTCLSTPIAYLILSASLKGYDRTLERAAANCGATPLQAFWLVTFPVLRPGFLAAGMFAFVHSFDEAIVSLFISGRDVSTLPRKMFDSLRTQADPVISVVSTLLLVLVVIGSLTPIVVRRMKARRQAALQRSAMQAVAVV
ncbi:ABC transporter permease subunit [Pandoraea fibrosis]|uniref:ABC transporter permease subunit n=1 Tax=Pandoraea fibrosis TaxID=1891094 RepID=A0ABX6HW88_9BURK|nr:ABC transporter permease [Pandoraea fibrosis]QHE91658.1 ABC transporter permease subunit [Pandoraea fibrosis]QHF14784.1 ABC transporter permease subunit [Pandoraea fibrosis]